MHVYAFRTKVPYPMIECNGLPDLCGLKFDQVTLPGTHNAGAGFDGPLRQCSGGEFSDCLFRNQGLNFKEQLELGIRFFDIDTCYLSEDCNTDIWGESGVFTCHGSYAYAGPISKVLRQIGEWMNVHPHEVVGINFNHNFQAEKRELIYTGLLQFLDDAWGPTAARKTSWNLTMSTFYHENGEWPTLLQAIQTNQRVFVFMSQALSNNEAPSRPSWIHTPPASTWKMGMLGDSSCSVLDSISCVNRSSALLEVSVYNFGVCISEMSQRCHSHLYNVTGSCYEERKQVNHTVNMVLVDYPEHASSPYTVTDTTRWLNEKNIRYFLGREPATLPTTEATTLPRAENGVSMTTACTLVLLMATVMLAMAL